MSPNDADGMANSVDPDQTAPISGSALFAQVCLSENLGSLPYHQNCSQNLQTAQITFVNILTFESHHEKICLCHM